MMHLKYADYPGKYHGFSLKEGYYYGVNTQTDELIATSGWECNGSVAIYTLTQGKWEMDWWNIEETDFKVENIPSINTEGKISFVHWLKNEQDIDWTDWDENYSGQMANEIEAEYNAYYYDGLPRFVQKYL